MMILKARLLYVIALSHEAKPLYEKLQAKLFVSKYGFKLYSVENNDNSVTDEAAILVTGSGSNAMASGLAWSQQYLPQVAVFLNLGVAGHGSLPIGASFIVSKVSDHCSGKQFYPHPIVKPQQELQFSELLTVSQPSKSYQMNCGYDMEASSFFETGRRFLNSEAVQSIKVVSDNTELNFTQLTPQVIAELIENNIHWVLSYAQQLMVNAIPNSAEFDADLMHEIQSKWSLSVSSQTILQNLLRSATCLAPHAHNDFPRPSEAETLKQYITLAKQWVLSVEPNLNPDVCSKQPVGKHHG